MENIVQKAIESGPKPQVDPVRRDDSAPTRDAGKAGKQRPALVRWAGVALLVVGVLAAARMLPLQEALLGLVAWVRAAGWIGAGVFVAAYVLAAVLFIPGSILTLGAGFAYGVAL